MRVVFKNYPLSNHDVWLCAITLAAVKMLRPRTGKTYLVRESLNTDYFYS
jgi:hypothetical protein